MKVLFVAGFGPIITDRKASLKLYEDVLGITFEELPDGYLYTESLNGVKHFSIFSLSQAAGFCFGKDVWPAELPTPQAWIEFDVEDIESATVELKNKGYRLISEAKKEPWGQVVTRFISPEGLLVAITHTPHLREEGREQ